MLLSRSLFCVLLMCVFTRYGDCSTLESDSKVIADAVEGTLKAYLDVHLQWPNFQSVRIENTELDSYQRIIFYLRILLTFCCSDPRFFRYNVKLLECAMCDVQYVT
mmetsp:Transcript_43895/g.114485  ORF Transcript_43895/g.114485 Transcript_43895/m.114485 type:complete len:106 (-) Transcript_43895:1518-1835(-)